MGAPSSLVLSATCKPHNMDGSAPKARSILMFNKKNELLNAATSPTEGSAADRGESGFGRGVHGIAAERSLFSTLIAGLGNTLLGGCFPSAPRQVARRVAFMMCRRSSEPSRWRHQHLYSPQRLHRGGAFFGCYFITPVRLRKSNVTKRFRLHPRTVLSRCKNQEKPR